LATPTFCHRIDHAEPDVAVIWMEGRLRGRQECWDFLDAARALVAQERHVVLDMQNVEHVDSTGVGILASLYTSARNTGSHLVLACMNKRVLRILDVLWFLRILDHTPTVEEAMEKVKEKRAAGSAEPA
jgi:anti-anti-sigma factor